MMTKKMRNKACAGWSADSGLAAPPPFIVAGNGVKTYKQVSHEYITVLSIAAERSPNEKGAGIGQNLAHHR